MSDRRTRAPWLARSTAAAPDRLVMLAFWTIMVVAATVLLEQFRPLVVLPLIAVVLVATWRLVPEPVAPTRAAVVGSALALTLAVAFVAVNVAYASRYVVIARDPGFLTLEAFWLTDNPDPEIPLGTAVAVAEAVPGAEAGGSAFVVRGASMYAQGAKLLPGVLALGAWVGGDAVVLGGNLLVGAFALVAVYGLARRMTGPIWALVPVIALATSMPMTVFSRAAYTEPLALGLAFGGMTLLWSGLGSRVWWRLVVGAAMVGATALVRIDGAAAVIGLVAGFGLVAGAARDRSRRRELGRSFTMVSAAGVGLVGLGYLDLAWHSPGYLSDLSSTYLLLAAGVATAIVGGIVVTAPRRWDRLRVAMARHSRVLGWAAVAIVLVAAVVLTSRPLWMVNRNGTEGTTFAQLVAGLQAREGALDVDVDGTRTYDEMTVTWLAWYFGWLAVVLGFVGLALVVRRGLVHRDPRWLVVASVIAAPSAMYLWRVSITPDQIWAMRRLLPLTVPGFLVLATVVLAALWARPGTWTKVAAVSGALAVAVSPLLVWNHELFTTVELDNRYGEATTICAGLPSQRVAFVGSAHYPPTLAVLCDAEVVSFDPPVTAEDLDRTREAWGDGTVSVVTFDAESVPWEDPSQVEPYLVISTTSWGYALSHIPREATAGESRVYLGVIGPDGFVAPLPAGEPAR